jgi:hypothetical protein
MPESTSAGQESYRRTALKGIPFGINEIVNFHS